MKALLLLVSLTVVAGNSQGDEIGLFELVNYFEYSPRLASSGQPTRDQLPALRDADLEAVINLAPANEIAAYGNEGKLVNALGMEYVHIPVDWEKPTPANLEAFFEAMQRLQHKRVLVHCYQNSRASAFVYLWRTQQAGHNEGEAFATLVEIWSWNDGYELENVAVWSRFVKQARIETEN